MVKPLALALLVVAGQAWRASTAPGPASRAHEKTEGNCDACHMPFKGLPNEKCLACHTGLKRFHASVAAKKCSACHTEHKGPTADLTKPAARAAFDHALTGMTLVGAHQTVPCAKCHAKPLAQLGQTCVGCHADTHKGSLGAACTTCHKAEAWKPTLHPVSAHTLVMEGKHATAACADCHAKGKNLVPKVACSACHEEAHGGSKAACEACHTVKAWKPATFDHSFCTCILPQKHQTVGCLGCHQDWNFTRTPTLCSGCHEKERKHEALGECSLCHSAVSWKKNQFEHNKRAKLKLTGEHLKVACEGCHSVAGAAMKFRGLPLTCEGCHQKKGDTAHGPFGPCAKCHSSEGFKPSTFEHASLGFPLEGRHTKLACKDCHAEKTRGYPKTPAPPKKAERSWLRGALAWTPTNDAMLYGATAPTRDAACSHCHADPHQGRATAAGECSTCHTSQAWKPSTFTVERHAAASFPLTGKHATTSCGLCHTDSKLNEVPKACGECHVDRHATRLGTACETCHLTTGFKPVVGFDHAATGFSLAVGHAKAPCASCHEGPRGKALAATARPAGAAVAAPPACTTCHQARHGPELGADCVSCHDPAQGPFGKARGMSFQHARTGFPLERRHATAACGACHPAAGPAPSAQCGACHADPHGGQLGRACEDCHQPDRFRVVRFDHDRAGWPLRGRHFMTPCASCHTAQRWVGLTDDCWDCHAAAAARGKSRVPSAHPFGPLDCAGCHTSMWKW